MKWAIAYLFISVLCVMLFFMQLDNNTAAISNERLKNAVNRAAHDASIASVDETTLGSGAIVFNPDVANVILENTLAKNLGLDSTLSPKPNTLFSENATIEFVDYIDDNDPITYPYLYDNPTYGLSKIIYGPAVVVVVSIQKPVISSISDIYTLRKGTVYEYPVP